MLRELPSSAQGFARNAGESIYPRLWDRYLGILVPWQCGRVCVDPSPARYDGSISGTSSALSVTASPIGHAIRCNGNVGIQWSGHATVGNKFKLAGPIGDMALTVQAYFKYAHKATSGHHMNLFKSDVPTIADPVGYQLHLDANTERMIFTVYDGTAPSPIAMEWISAASYLTPGKWHTFAMTMFAADVGDIEIGQIVMFWLDGKIAYPTQTINRSAIAFTNSLHSKLGGRESGLDPELDVALLSMWNRRLAWREIDQINVDPLMMFRRSEMHFASAGSIVPAYLNRARRAG